MNSKLVTLLKIVLPILVVAVAAVSAARLAAMRPVPDTRRPDVPLPVVRAQLVALVDVQLTVQSQGTVAPRTESRIVPEVSGRVVWVSPNFVSGGFFDADEPLLRVDSFDHQRAVVRARSEVAAAHLRLAQEETEAELARQEWEDLGTGEATALTLHLPQLANARAGVQAAQANLQKTERDLERTEIRAPYAGRVRSKIVDIGQYVRPGDDMGTIYSIDTAEIRLPLPDEDLAYLDLPLVYRGERARLGPRVRLVADFAGRTWEWYGRIVRTEGEIDPASRMVHAVAQVANPYGRGPDPARPPLAVGMYVRAEIDGITVKNVAVIPRAALRADGRLLVIDAQERLWFRDVSVLRATRQEIIVDGGLENGERVCLSSLDVVTDGMRVRVAGDGAGPTDTGRAAR